MSDENAHESRNEIEHRIARIERSVGRQEKAWQRNEARIIEALERLKGLEKQMATLDEQLDALKASFDAATTKLGGDLDILIADFKSAGSLTPAQQAKLDAFSSVSATLKDLDDKTAAAVAGSPPVTPPVTP